MLIAYAVKAENNLSILKMMADEGIGADVVSIGETLKYIKAGGKAENIVFSGVAKTEEEIRKSIELNIKRFNIESIPEAVRINNIAKEMKKRVYVFPNSIIEENGKKINYHEFLQSTLNEDCLQAVKKIIPKIEEKSHEIRDFINNIEVLSPVRMQFYTQILQMRRKLILQPALARADNLTKNA